MDASNMPPQGLSIVVHPNPLVAEDLREILGESGFAQVLVVGSLAEADGHRAAVVIVAGAYERVVASDIVSAWRAEGTDIIILNGKDRHDPSPAGVHILEQPFRSEDVLTILRRIRLAR